MVVIQKYTAYLKFYKIMKFFENNTAKKKKI